LWRKSKPRGKGEMTMLEVMLTQAGINGMEGSAMKNFALLNFMPIHPQK